jgi:hypothetical protein
MQLISVYVISYDFQWHMIQSLHQFGAPVNKEQVLADVQT